MLLSSAFVLVIICIVVSIVRSNYRSQRQRSNTQSKTSLTSDQFTESKQKPPNAEDTVLDYASVFPPSRRAVLSDLKPGGKQEIQKTPENTYYDEENVKKGLLAWEQDYRLASDSQYVYSGLSVGEIKALGHFPDYAHLCGVPLPDAYHEFNIDRALPRPYRPFRWAYHQTMSLSKLEPNFWLELENTYRTRIAERKRLYAEHGESVLQWLPGSELACKELMEMALQFLCARYPHYFQMTAQDGDNSRMSFCNRILETTEIVQDRHPLLVLLDHVPEDFAIMLRRPSDGGYVFRAGILCSALGWNVGTKINKRLHEIHEPVPDYREKLQFSMDRYFARMPADKPIQRTSWGLEVDQPLYMPPGHPHEKLRTFQSDDLTLDRIHLRLDHQTLRRLPLSGAIVFNFKALFTPITEFRNEPFIPSLVLHICKNAKQNLMDYKATWHVEHVALPALEQYEREQIASGVIAKDWDVNTLDEHPFFPGWREKWHRQQGF